MFDICIETQLYLNLYKVFFKSKTFFNKRHLICTNIKNKISIVLTFILIYDSSSVRKKLHELKIRIHILFLYSVTLKTLHNIMRLYCFFSIYILKHIYLYI